MISVQGCHAICEVFHIFSSGREERDEGGNIGRDTYKYRPFEGYYWKPNTVEMF